MPAVPLKITILGSGTSQGVPVLACKCEVCLSQDLRDKRLRSSILVESPTTTLVVDTGPDFRQQLLKNGTERLDAVLFTHEHKDHMAGLDDVRAFNFSQASDMPLYCSESVEGAIRRDFYYAFSDNPYPGVPKLNPVRIHKDESFWIGDIHVQPVMVWHHKMPVFGFRFGDFCYITDANRIDDEELQKMKGLNFLVINALRVQEHISHFNLKQALEVVDTLKPAKTFFTHISHYLGLHEKVSQALPTSTALAFDGLSFFVSGRGK
jgi:phosphoribosyl 1,2-cyclic phosphate phosphodiesterase